MVTCLNPGRQGIPIIHIHCLYKPGFMYISPGSCLLPMAGEGTILTGICKKNVSASGGHITQSINKTFNQIIRTNSH
jgi:hypothetical protein